VRRIRAEEETLHRANDILVPLFEIGFRGNRGPIQRIADIAS